MSFEYTMYPAEERERRWHRLLCILPAALSWGLLVGLAVAAFASPSVGAALIIAFLLYYIARVGHNTIFLAVSFIRIRVEERSDWLGRLADLALRARGTEPEERLVLRGRLLSWLHQSVVDAAREARDSLPSVAGLVQLVIVPICNERRSVYEQGIAALSRGIIDPARCLVLVLAVEERCGEGVLEDARAAREHHAGAFRDMLLIVHPADLPGEVPGKGSNVGFAARAMGPYFAERSIDLTRVLLTCIDADAVVGPEYFACLCYYFLAEPKRARACFQPLSVFSNNIWRVPSLVRVIEMGSTAFQLIDSTNVDLLVTFSCYSYSYQALAESGFWPVDVITEDAGVYWKTFLHYRGDFRAVPLPVTVRMDAAEGPTFWKTLRSAYRQKLRWAYAAENEAIVLRGLFRHRAVSGRRKWTTVLKVVENNLSMATWPFILSVLIWLPQLAALLSRLVSATTPLPVFNLGRISGTIFQLTGVFLALIVVVTGIFAYTSSAKASLWKKLRYPLEWLIVLPVASLALGAIPALHAQTRLALGKPLVYVPMEKFR